MLMTKTIVRCPHRMSTSKAPPGGRGTSRSPIRWRAGIKSDPEDRDNNGDDLSYQRNRTTAIVDKMNLIISVKF